MQEVFVFICLALSVWLISCAVEARSTFWAAEVLKVRDGGYVPPAPYFLTNLLCRAVCFTLGFLEVGPIKIVGKERLPKNGPRIIAPFHIDAGDASIVSALIGISPMYYLIRTTEVLGYRGWIATMTGAIAVDEETQEGRTRAFKAAVTALSSGGPNAQLVIFPQGQLVPDEVIRRHEFKSGTMAIAKLCARKRKEPIWIVPLGVHYKTDPKEATLFQKIVQGLGFKKFRNLFGHQNYGAVAVVGRPFQVTPKTAQVEDIARGIALDDDAEKATDMYVQRLSLLQRSAKKHSAGKLDLHLSLKEGNSD
ncbi:MAG: 1-acyl-sn-glycerol-3-phosphate acyltransferase [Candidatus Melainabacteria bacterium]|nr:1-acyl-sn-glycerol-3-phosphate acyltransferase [Candidatus Melainabacteria bacterium]